MRTLSGPTAAAAAGTYTQPGHLVQMGFSSVLRGSTRGDEMWNSFTWLGFNIVVSQIKELPNGSATVTITVGNADLAMGALCLTEAPQDKAVSIWAFYEGALATADPVPVFSGVIDSCVITEQSVTLQCLQVASKTLYIPRLRISPATGFNRLMPPGRVIQYAGQRYQIEQAPSS